MKLLTSEIKKKMPLQVKGKLEEAPIIVKFFGGGSYTLYVVSAEVYINGQDEKIYTSMGMLPAFSLTNGERHHTTN